MILLISSTGAEGGKEAYRKNAMKGKQLEVSYLMMGLGSCSIYKNCGTNLLSSSLDGNDYSIEGVDLIRLEREENLIFAEASKDEAFENFVDSARDELFGEREHSESFDRGAVVSYHDFCQAHFESIARW